jgi:eukaryotic-like serine/threonine-protein kinase
MTITEWQRVKELLYAAMQLAPLERSRFLDDACGSDSTLRGEIDSLLAADGQVAQSFLEPTAAETRVGSIGAGDVLGERFVLLRKLGDGGMGQVWLAEQTTPVRRLVALKLIRAGIYDENLVHRLQSERQSLAIMDHPAIAKVFEAGATPQGQPYFVMEYVPGPPITEYCDQNKLSIRERLELFIQACAGVQHAHQKAIIHRDLKPANILVVEVDGKPVPRIIDFGLAKMNAARVPDQNWQTQLGLLVGTPGYMSPEQVDPAMRDIDTRSDVYSLGVILYVLLTGLQPFETRGQRRPPLYEWLRQLREEDAPSLSSKVTGDRDSAVTVAAARATGPSQLVSLLRGDLEWITAKALERDRERRYATPSELAADLRRYLNDEAVMARPASAAYQLRKFIRRHRTGAAVVGMVSVLGIVASIAGVIALRKQHEAEYQRHAAEHAAAQALQAQSRLLTQAAAQRLKDADVTGAQNIILEVLTNPVFAQMHTPAAISVFQDVRAADPQIAVLSGHTGPVLSSVYSPDGARILTGSADKTARIWDARTGAQLLMLTGHADRVQHAAYSPDGARIVTASADKTVRIWDAATGALLGSLVGHGDAVNWAAYSPDGTRIVTASEDMTARIWDARTQAQLVVLSGHGNHVNTAAYSRDGTRIVTASDDKTARIWNARSGALVASLAGHSDVVYAAAYSGDGARIVTASGDHTARIWDARTGAPLAVISGHGDRVYRASFSPDGAQVVTASADKSARIWDARTGAELWSLSGHGERVRSAAYSPDGARIVTGAEDDTARTWDARDMAQLAMLSGHGDRVYAAAYSRDGSQIVTAAADETARIWDVRSGQQALVLSGHSGYVYGARFSPDGARVVTAGYDKTARIWDARAGTQLEVLSGHSGAVYAAGYSPDGTRVATASGDKTARIWDAATGSLLIVLSGHGGAVFAAAFSPDGTRLVTGSSDKTARTWDAASGAQLAVLSGHTAFIGAAAYSPDGTRIVTASGDKTARIWDARTGAQLIVLIGHGGIINGVGYSRDGSRIVTASGDKTARIWDASTGAQLAVLSVHNERLTAADYSPDGTRIVTASMDKSVRIWDALTPAPLAEQILWDASAEADALPDVERDQLGLPVDARVKSWSTPSSACDQGAGAPYDPERAAPGVSLARIAADIVGPECAKEIGQSGHGARSDYEMGRILVAKGDTEGARRQLEIAVAKGYRAAGIDLADLLTIKPSSKLDADRAVSLYEQAWRQRVPIAAFRLGHYYEYPGAAATQGASQAWRWYQQGADAGEPSALARLAEREESNALVEPDSVKRTTQWLQAFKLYAAAAERARLESWPDDAWKAWRQRRSSLARVLAREGLMQQVADAYGTALAR